jgi:putative SOS response-associated peptidase YedK
MCSRYTLRRKAEELARLFKARLAPGAGLESLSLRFNIAPSQSVVVACRDKENPGSGAPGVVLRLMRWGLAPRWVKDNHGSGGGALINARIETAMEKPSFRDAMRRRRCLIPADGFYEWTTTPTGKKQPHYIHRRDDGVMGFAGLWESGRGEDGGELATCAILTTQADGVVRPLHDRMPVIVDPARFAHWVLAPSPEEALAALAGGPGAAELAAHLVNPRVNRPAVDDVRCVDPFDPESVAQGRLF